VSNAANWLQYMQNPKAHLLKKLLGDILGGKAMPYLDLIDRVSVPLVTEADLTLFNRLLVEIYEVGYLKAVEDHKAKLAELGFKVAVVPQTKG